MYKGVLSGAFILLGLFMIVCAFVTDDVVGLGLNSFEGVADNPLSFVKLISGFLVIVTGYRRSRMPVPKIFVREIVTDMIALVFVVLFAYLLYKNSLNPNFEISPILISIVSIIIGYYFGKTFKK